MNIKATLESIVDRPLLDWGIAGPLAVGVYFAWSRWLPLVAGAPLSDALFAVAGVFGTMAGFLSASLLFVAGVDNSSMRAVRRVHGPLLNSTLLGATVALLVAALTAAVCGLTSNGWIAQIVALAVSILALVKLLRVSIVLRGVLATVLEVAGNAPPSASQTPPPPP